MATDLFFFFLVQPISKYFWDKKTFRKCTFLHFSSAFQLCFWKRPLFWHKQLQVIPFCNHTLGQTQRQKTGITSWLLHECSCFIELIKLVGKKRWNARLAEWFIYVQLTDKQWIITQQFTHALELIYFDSNTQ